MQIGPNQHQLCTTDDITATNNINDMGMDKVHESAYIMFIMKSRDEMETVLSWINISANQLHLSLN